MNELEYADLTTLKKQLEEAINCREWVDAVDLLDSLWREIQDWYRHEKCGCRPLRIQYATEPGW